MTKSELIAVLATKLPHVPVADTELTVKLMLQQMTETLASGERIELRGFGTFALKPLPARVGRNPKSGEPIALPERYSVHFKPGKALRERVNATPLSSTD